MYCISESPIQVVLTTNLSWMIGFRFPLHSFPIQNNKTRNVHVKGRGRVETKDKISIKRRWSLVFGPVVRLISLVRQKQNSNSISTS